MSSLTGSNLVEEMRMAKAVVDRFFSKPVFPSECEHESKLTVEQKRKEEEEFQKLQKEALQKQSRRNETMGEILRNVYVSINLILL